MRRLLLIMFLVVLPLQFAWGAAARYCDHESSTASKHFGHHAHVHQGGAEGDKAKPAPADDADCGYCHLGCAQPLASSPPLLAVIDAQVHIAETLSPPGSPDGSVIDKPNWFFAA